MEQISIEELAATLPLEYREMTESAVLLRKLENFSTRISQGQLLKEDETLELAYSCYAKGCYESVCRVCEIWQNSNENNMSYLQGVYIWSRYLQGKSYEEFLPSYLKLLMTTPQLISNEVFIYMLVAQSTNMSTEEKKGVYSRLLAHGNEQTFENLLFLQFQSGDLNSAEALLKEMNNMGVLPSLTPDKFTQYQRVIEHYRRGGDATKEVRVNGIPMKFKLDGKCPDTDFNLINHESVQLDELDLLKAHLPEKANCVDVGANIGMHTMSYLMNFGCASVLSVEANPATVDSLSNNVELNGLGNTCQVVSRAVGHKTGKIPLVVGGHSSAVRYFEGGINTVEVEMSPLDELITHKVDFIKIDVEGNEMDAVLGAARTIMESRPLVFIECWPRHKRRMLGLMQSFEYGVIAETHQDILFRPIENAL